MPVLPQVQGLLEQMEAQGLPPFDQMSVPQARDVAMAFRDLQGEPEQVGEVRDLVVPGPAGQLPVRVYHPEPGTALPLLVYFHGGGWVIGNIEVVDKPCRALANASRCVVAAVQYRLAPETKFPGAPEDCHAATKWLAEHAGELGADGGRLIVGGDSAGGNLAAVVALMARDRGGPSVAYQLLIYPATAPMSTDFASRVDNAEGYLLTTPSMVWFWDHYLSSPADATNPYATPISASDLSGLPPAMVITAEFDPLRDEGAAYAERLQQAGVTVKTSRYNGVIHGFFWMAGVLDVGREVIAEMGDELRKQFG